VTRLALLPLDDRPVNYDQPWWLGKAAGIEVVRPPREWLGSPLRPAARDRLAGWLADEGRAVDGIVVAIDTLAYGGLIPSRQGRSSLDEVVRNLEPLRAIRAARPELPILAFSVLMRVNRSNSAEEEKPYWANHGRDMFRLSYLEDKTAHGAASDLEATERQALASTVPADIVADYRAGRTRNHAVNRLVVEWLAAGVLDYVVIAQDDTAPFGWNIAEARTLTELIAKQGLSERAIVYPGADEVGSLLVAAFVCRAAGFRPRVWPLYSGTEGPTMVTAYEDRPLSELLYAHLGPLSGGLARGPAEADLVLAINAPGEAQTDAWVQLPLRQRNRAAIARASAADEIAVRAAELEMATARRDVDELARAIAMFITEGRTVGIVDVAFVNGADLALADRLMTGVPLARLGSYAAWNTAGNSLGSALAHGVIRAVTRSVEQPTEVLEAHLGLLAIHLIDDYAFQGIVRTEMMLYDLPSLGLQPSFDRLPEPHLAEMERRLRARLAPHVESLGQKMAAETVANGDTPCRLTSLTIDAATLPWERLFEVAITPRIELA
jgi:hypothetical protein